MSKSSDSIDKVEQTFGPFAAFVYALILVGVELVKLYVIYHFVVKYW